MLRSETYKSVAGIVAALDVITGLIVGIVIGEAGYYSFNFGGFMIAFLSGILLGFIAYICIGWLGAVLEHLEEINYKVSGASRGGSSPKSSFYKDTTPIEPPVTHIARDGWTCKNCGKLNAKSDTFCKGCGEYR